MCDILKISRDGDMFIKEELVTARTDSYNIHRTLAKDPGFFNDRISTIFVSDLAQDLDQHLDLCNKTPLDILEGLHS